MMTLRIAPSHVAGPWRFADGAWRRGASFVRPFPHRAIETLAVETADATLILVRDNPRKRADGVRHRLSSPCDSAAWIERLAAWPLDIQIVMLPRAGERVTVACGELATAPLFLTPDGSGLAADWDIARLYPIIPGGLDFGRAAYSLCHLGLPYSRRTIFSSVLQLTERARASWDAASGALSIAYPAPAPRPAPRPIRPGADVPAAFEALFGAIVRRALGEGAEPLATELSGGLDSAVATIVCARALGRERIRSFGLLLPGPQQAAQAMRRDAIAGALGVADCALPAAPPFSQGDLAGLDPAIPWGEYYREAFLALGAAMAEAGCARLVRGIGGDEISELGWDEIEADETAAAPSEPDLPSYLTAPARAAAAAAAATLDPAPEGFAATSFYRSAAASAPVYLRRGIWPAYPYGTPELVAFCRSLPAEWRVDRNLQRTFLARAGMPADVVRPNPPETFLPLRDGLFAGGAADHVRALFDRPILAELGLVDAARLATAFERAVDDPVLPGRTRLMEAATLETVLRTWRRTSAPMGP